MQSFLLTGTRSRQAACDVIMQAPPYSTATIKPQKRSDEQNAKMWAMLSDISRAKPEGRAMIPELWKSVFMAACGHQVQFINGLDGMPFPVGFRSSRLSKDQMADLLTLIQQKGDEWGVQWSNEAAE